MSKCKECGKAVSTLAKTCPSCGVPKPATKSKIKKKTVSKKSISRDIIPNIKNSGGISLLGFVFEVASTSSARSLKTPSTAHLPALPLLQEVVR